MKILLLFLLVTFALGVREAGRRRPTKAVVILTLSVIAAAALQSTRFV